MILAGFFGLAQAQSSSASDGHVQSATAISRVLGDGRKVETVVLEYDTPISNKSQRSGKGAAGRERAVRHHRSESGSKSERIAQTAHGG